MLSTKTRGNAGKSLLSAERDKVVEQTNLFSAKKKYFYNSIYFWLVILKYCKCGFDQIHTSFDPKKEERERKVR